MAAVAAVVPTTPPPLSSPSSFLSHFYFNNGRSAFTTSRPRKPSSVHLRAAANTRRIRASFDPDIRVVLELASDSELYDIESILFGPSYFSPVLKSLARRNDAECYLCLDVPEEREEFIHLLESRFLFLAADARSTIRGWRPSYRNVLLDVRKKLGIPCSSKLPTGDLEAEIFLHLLQEYSGEKAGEIPLLQEDGGGAGYGPQPRNMQASALKVVADEVRALILKGGSALTFARIFQVLARKLSGKVLTEAANYQIKREILKKGGQLAAINLESRIALLAARQGFSSAASRYLGFRSLTMFLGTMYAEFVKSLHGLWGTFLADVVIQMMGTDYSRIVRAIYAFAQIRLMRIYAWGSHQD